MTKQEEIREGWLAEIKYIMKVGSDKTKIAEAECYTDEILRFQSDRGVVIKVDRELPERTWYKDWGGESGEASYKLALEDMAGYVAVKPLIEVKK